MSLLKKIVAIATALTVLVWVGSPAMALTVEELEAQIAALLEQLATLQDQLSELKGETGECPCTFTRNLYPGMSGDDVKCLQEYLNDTGYTLADSGPGSPGEETTYFGPLTRAAVKEWQDANDVEYGDYWGYFGPKSQAAYDATCEVVECETDADCAEGYICSAGECIEEVECTTDADCPEGYTCEDEICVEEAPPTEEYLSVELSEDTPGAGAIPYGAQFVPYTKFDFSAGLEDVTIDTITITRSGQGDKNDFDYIWLLVGDAVVSNHKSITSEDTAILNLSDYEIPSGDTVTFTLIGDMANSSSDAGHINALGINSADDIDCDEEVTGDFPVVGTAQTIVNYAIATATFDDKGAASTIDIGDEEVTVGEFSLQVSSTTNKDGLFESIRLKQKGTGKLSDLDNLDLYIAGDKVSTETIIDGEYITFVLGDGYEMERGKTRIFTIKADVVSGDDADTIIFTLKKEYDLVVIEEGSVYGAAVTITTNDLKTYTLNAGKFSVSKDSTSPANQEVGLSAEDVTALIAKMDLGQAVKVDGLDVYLHTDSKHGGGATNLTTTYDSAVATLIDADVEEVSLYVDGTFIDSVDTVSDCSGTGVYSDYCYEFATEFEMEDDDLIEVIIDIEEAAIDSNIYKFVFSNTHFDSPEYVDSGESVASGDKSGTATGNTVTIKSASVTHTRNDGYANGQKFVRGTEDAKLLQWVTTANESSDITVKTLNFDFTVLTSDTEYTNFTNLTVEAGGEVVGGPKDLSDGSGSNDGLVTFDGMDYDISAGGQAVFSLYSDISDAASTSIAAMAIKLDVSDCTFYDDQGDTLGSGYYGSDVDSATLDIVGGGTLSVSLNGDTPDNAILISSTTDNEVAAFDFVAEDGEINVTDIYVANDFDDDNSADSDADARISALELIVDGEVVDSRVPTSGTVHFDLGTEDAITVPKDGSEKVSVRADLTSITSEGQTNKRLKLHLYRVEISETDATNALSSGTIAGSNTVEAKEMVITKTAPVVTAASVDGTLTNGWDTIFAFNVEAADGAIGIKKIIFDVTGAYGASTTSITDLTTVIVEGASSADTTGVKIYKAGTEEDATIDISNNNKILVTFDTVQSIETSKSYTLKANLEAFVPEKANTLQTNIDEGSTSYKAAEAWATTYSSGTTATFVWTDNSGTMNSLTDAQWMNDRYVSGLASDFATIVMQ